MTTFSDGRQRANSGLEAPSVRKETVKLDFFLLELLSFKLP